MGLYDRLFPKQADKKLDKEMAASIRVATNSRGLFDRLFPKEKVQAAKEARQTFQTLTAYRPHFTTWNGCIFESELVRAAIDVRARHISKLKVEITGTANKKLQSRLKLRPAPWCTWNQMLYRLSVILDIHNTAILVPVYDEMMDVTGYYPILPKKCEIIDVNGDPWLRYTFKNGKRAADRLANCAILTRFQYKSDFFGTNNEALEPTMKLIHLQNEGIAEAVKSGATFRFMAQMKNFSRPDDLVEERRRFVANNLRTEDDADGGILLFPNTYTDIKQIDSKPYTISEAEQKNIRDNVFNYFGVNDEILQSKAYGDKWAAFYESVIEPFAIQFSETLTFAAFTEREIAQGTSIMATANRLQYMSTAEKLNVSSQMADRGILNRDEVREIWNLPPLPDGQGQAYIIRGEYYSADEKLTDESPQDATEEARSEDQETEQRTTPETVTAPETAPNEATEEEADDDQSRT